MKDMELVQRFRFFPRRPILTPMPGSSTRDRERQDNAAFLQESCCCCCLGHMESLMMRPVCASQLSAAVTPPVAGMGLERKLGD